MEGGYDQQWTGFVPDCRCRIQCRTGIVKNASSPNFGRFFASCSRKGQYSCNYFQWLTDLNPVNDITTRDRDRDPAPSRPAVARNGQNNRSQFDPPYTQESPDLVCLIADMQAEIASLKKKVAEKESVSEPKAAETKTPAAKKKIIAPVDDDDDGVK